jgi:SAM-dependent methyltransferase
MSGIDTSRSVAQQEQLIMNAGERPELDVAPERGSPRQRSIGARFVALTLEVRRWLLAQRWFTSTVLPLLPRRARWALRTAFFFPLDVADARRGERPPMVPLRRDNFTGTVHDFIESGENDVRRMERFAGLTPTAAVLDLGSGMGRLGRAMTAYLDPAQGTYDGVEIVPRAVQWCQREITTRYPNVRFHLAEVRNGEYQPDAKLGADEYRFPFPDNHFDLVVLLSVFTHMLPAEVRNYVREITRVLKTGGRCYATFSLLDAHALQAMDRDAAERKFRPFEGAAWVVDAKVPELATAYDQEFVEDLLRTAGLEPQVFYGSWVAREAIPATAEIRQDVVLATKRAGG